MALIICVEIPSIVEMWKYHYHSIIVRSIDGSIIIVIMLNTKIYTYIDTATTIILTVILFLKAFVTIILKCVQELREIYICNKSDSKTKRLTMIYYIHNHIQYHI